MLDLASKYRDVKIWGRGKNVSGHREFSPVGKQVARRAYNRAARRAAREICREAAYQEAEVTIMANETTLAGGEALVVADAVYEGDLEDDQECRCCCCTGECREYEVDDPMFAGFAEGDFGD